MMVRNPKKRRKEMVQTKWKLELIND